MFDHLACFKKFFGASVCFKFWTKQSVVSVGNLSAFSAVHCERLALVVVRCLDAASTLQKLAFTCFHNHPDIFITLTLATVLSS